MKGLIIYRIPPCCTDDRIVACLNLYGNLINYTRIADSAFIAFSDPPPEPLPIVWWHDYRLNVSIAHNPVPMIDFPPFIPKHLADRVRFEFKRFQHAIEYIVTGYPRTLSLEQLRKDVIVHLGHFVSIQRKRECCFVLFDCLVREPAFPLPVHVEMSHRGKRKFEETEVCVSCNAFNPPGFEVCVLCTQKRCFCVWCKRENLPGFKYCGSCGVNQASSVI